MTSSLGRQIHAALPGDYWIPYCISVGNSVIRLFDEQCHQRVDVAGEQAWAVDQRWARVRRPLNAAIHALRRWCEPLKLNRLCRAA